MVLLCELRRDVTGQTETHYFFFVSNTWMKIPPEACMIFWTKAAA